MNRKLQIFLLFLILVLGFCIGIVYATTFSYTYDTATPDGSDDPAEADDRMREIKAAIQERANVDHYWPLTGTEVSDAEAGEHRKVLFNDPIATTPTVAEDHGSLRIKDVNSIAELHWTDESKRELQFTSMGNNLPHNTYLTASNVAGDGSVNLIKADHNDVAVVPDNTQTATNAAPTSTTGIANKKYVDDQVAFVDRGDAGAADKGQTDLTVNGTWTDLDLSSIVTDSDATAILMRVSITDGTPDTWFGLRENGNSNTSNSSIIMAQVDSITIHQDMIVNCDSSQVVEYYKSAAIDTITLVVRGWWK